MKTCEMCGKELTGKYLGQKKFCGKGCNSEYYRKKYRELNPIRCNVSKIGAMNELLVCVDLLGKKCEVYRQVAQNKCDLAIIHKDKFLKVEVTTGHFQTTGSISHPHKDRAKFDVLAIVIEGKIIYEPDIFTEY